MPIGFANNYLSYIDWNNRVYYFQLKKNLYANNLFGGRIDKLDGNFYSYNLSGLGNPLVEESTPSFVEDTTWIKVNFRSLTVNSIFDGQYALAIYFFQDIPILELIEETKFGSLKAVQVLNLSEIKGFSELESGKFKFPHNGDGICISNDKIYLSVFKEGEHFLYEYPIFLKKQTVKEKYYID